MEQKKSSLRSGRRRPVAVADALKRRDQRRRDRLAAAKEREQRIAGAEKDYTQAWEAIELAKQDLDDELAALDKRAEQARARTERLIEQQQRSQARAAAALRAERCSVEEIAEILQIPAHQVRSLLAQNRRHSTDDAPAVTEKTESMRAQQDLEADATLDGASVVSSNRIEPRNDSSFTPVDR